MHAEYEGGKFLVVILKKGKKGLLSTCVLLKVELFV